MAAFLFRVDAGPTVGLGHLSRCLSLAEALKRSGHSIVVLTGSGDEANLRITSAGHVALRLGIDTLGGDADCDGTIAAARQHSSGAVIVDSYSVDGRYLGRVRNAGLLVAAIDDWAREPFPAHVVVNGGAQATRLNYRSSFGDTRFLLGPRYALLQPEFWRLRERELRPTVQRLLVTVGGTDARGVTAALLRGIDDLKEPFAVTVAVGPFFANSEEIDRVVSQCRHQVTVVRSGASLVSLMLAADLAVAGGGQTLYELAATGTPAIGLSLFDNQTDSLCALNEAGVVAFGGAMKDREPPATFIEALQRLMRSHEARSIMSRAGQRLVDGGGAMRVAEELGKVA